MFAETEKLSVSVQKFVNIISALREGDSEITAFDICLMSSDSVNCADISGIFFARQQFFSVGGE